MDKRLQYYWCQKGITKSALVKVKSSPLRSQAVSKYNLFQFSKHIKCMLTLNP